MSKGITSERTELPCSGKYSLVAALSTRLLQLLSMAQYLELDAKTLGIPMRAFQSTELEVMPYHPLLVRGEGRPACLGARSASRQGMRRHL